MVLKRLIKSIFHALSGVREWSETPSEKSLQKQEKAEQQHNATPAEQEILLDAPKEEKVSEIHSIWEYIKIRDNTQAHHLTSVIGFEWVEMREIRRRIKEQFGMEYMNERSLYPYIKTFTDCGLFESSDVGGTRKWRKKEIIISPKGEEKKPAAPIEFKEREKKKEKDNGTAKQE
ncbi:MAG: hypothetical protein JW772_03370 [Candidatus Diapherotrites archaeon]|nr:hypothetical protein [Candidatus Diapherotrites archaeon]